MYIYNIIILTSILLNLFLVRLLWLEYKNNVTRVNSIKNKYEKTVRALNSELIVANKLMFTYRIFQHDFRQDVPKIIKSLKENDLTNAETLLRNLHKKCFLDIDRKYSDVLIVETLINDRKYIIDANNIEVSIKLRHYSLGYYGAIEMEQLLKLLIDFAINSCENSDFENKTIRISTTETSAKMLNIFIAFSSDRKLNKRALGDEIIKLLKINEIEYVILNDRIKRESTIALYFSYHGFELMTG